MYRVYWAVLALQKEIQWKLEMRTLLGPVQYNIGVSTFQGFEEFIAMDVNIVFTLNNGKNAVSLLPHSFNAPLNPVFTICMDLRPTYSKQNLR